MHFSSRKLAPLFLIVMAVLLLTGVFRFAEKPQRPQTSTARVTTVPSVTIPPLEANENQVLGGSESAVLVSVVKVVDGDTITVLVDGERQTVRLIGINTPETVDPRRPVECFGKEASVRAKELLRGKSVRLTADPTQADRDRYNRLLRYVYLEDGMLFNQVMIEEGYAYEYTYERPYQYQMAFKEAQKRAQEQMKGLWDSKTCNGGR
jgi:micrococcal nuclease